MKIFFALGGILAIAVLCAQETRAETIDDEMNLSIKMHSNRNTGDSAFFKDKSWQLASRKGRSSWGRLFGRSIHKRAGRAPRVGRLARDWAQSTTARPSSMTIMSYANQKRAEQGKAPTRYLEGMRRKDESRKPSILNPSFRSFRGRYPRREVVYQDRRARQLQELQEIQDGNDASDIQAHIMATADGDIEGVDQQLLHGAAYLKAVREIKDDAGISPAVDMSWVTWDDNGHEDHW